MSLSREIDQTDDSLTALKSQRVSNDVAIIGMACRVPGGNDSPEQLWQYLLDRKVASGRMPPERWEPYHRRDPRNMKIINQTSSRGYYLDHLENFDAQFFGISPLEAEQMDPQQRLSLEVTWEALENAGIPTKHLSGSDTAVFWGINSNDYSQLVLEDLANVEAWMGIGTASCGVPNRISYHLDLHGPSSAVDAACASSLVALHHGAQSILSGESSIAIVGGANALCSPGLFRALDQAGALSPDGCCCSFDDSACGYARGEGAAAIILKDMSQAVLDRDSIFAVIKGTAVGHDGKTNGIMAPNARAQALVARRALEVAGIDPRDVDFIEAHATSTPLGDVTELSALASVYGAKRNDSPCFIGSIKPNIGHLEAGAGAIGLIKAVLAVRKGIIPPQANLQIPTKRFNWDASGLKVARQIFDWPKTTGPRRAAISSYGYGGTVSHVIIEEYIPTDQSTPPVADLELLTNSPTRPYVLLLSAQQEKRLVAQAHLLTEWLQSKHRRHSLGSIASTLALRRDHYDHRAALVVECQEEAIETLKQLAGSKSHYWTTQGRVLEPRVNSEIVWVFSGHGAQWREMARDLLKVPVFSLAIEPLDNIVNREMGVSPMFLLQSCDFESSEHVQILTYVMQIGISAILHSHGIFPQAVIGHSVGEIAASVVAGALTPEEGMTIVTRRAVLYRGISGRGAMALVNQPYDEIVREVEAIKDVVVAIDTSPSSCVISGSIEAVAGVEEDLKKRGIKVLRVKTDIPFHSPLLKPLEIPLILALGDNIFPKPPTKARLYSTCLRDPRGQDLRDSKYWGTNMVDPVRFTPAIKAALEDSYRIFMEISSHPIVTHSINDTIMDVDVADCLVLPTLMRGKPAEKSILRTAAELHCHGIHIDWKYQMTGSWTTDLPNTRWVHRPTWRKIETGATIGAMTHQVESHTLLGARIHIAGSNMILYITTLDQNSKPFPLSHPVHGTEITPAACLLHTLLKAAHTKTLEEVVFRVPLATKAPRVVQVIVSGLNEVKILSRPVSEYQDVTDNSSSWVTHTTAKCGSQSSSLEPREQRIEIETTKARIHTHLPNDFTIDYLRTVGVSAVAFPWVVTEHFGNSNEMLAHVTSLEHNLINGDSVLSDHTSWAPLLDSATSVGSTLFFEESRLRMPAQLQRAEIFTEKDPPKDYWLHVQKAPDSPLTSDISIVDNDRNVLAKLTAMRFSEIEGGPGVHRSVENLVHEISWFHLEPTKEKHIAEIFLVSDNVSLTEKYVNSTPKDVTLFQMSSIPDLVAHHRLDPIGEEAVIVYVPDEVLSIQDIPVIAQSSSWKVLEILKLTVRSSLSARIYILTCNTAEATNLTALAHSTLVGLSRILASEHPDHFGGLIDSDSPTFPISMFQNSQGFDVVRVRNGQAAIARLQSLPDHRMHPLAHKPQLLPRPEGTYLITGGMGALGLQVAAFLVGKGARRLILVSRRRLPPRKTWNCTDDGDMAIIIGKIKDLEAQGASIYVMTLDISIPSSAQALSDSLDDLAWPPVLGVVHAAGVLEDQLALETTEDAFSRVLAPKVIGSLVLHQVFPPGSVDFFVLFSSCGQLVGFTGQSSYGSANAFLDALATHRKMQGDRAVSFLWTAWRGLGMGANSEYINAELENKGISDITSDDAFKAWIHLGKYDTDHGVILRSLIFDEGEDLPSAILTDIAIRRQGNKSQDESESPSSTVHEINLLQSASEISAYLDHKIRSCVAKVLHTSVEDIDPRAALSDLGIDSVMTVTVRRKLQQTLQVKIPSTLIWTHPTVRHLVEWFILRMRKE